MPTISPLLPVLIAILLGGAVDEVDGPSPKEVRPGFVEVGSVRYHPERGEVEATGWFNLRGGFIEFLACIPGVKSHEALVSLDCDPIDLKAAILLLGVTEGDRPESEGDLGPIAGDRLMVRFRYAFEYEDGTKVLRDIRAEDVIINAPLEKEMARSGFVFTGSTFIEDPEVEPEEGKIAPEVFAPTVLGQLIALSHRPYAILDNPMALPYRDGDYFAYTEMLPLLSRDEPTPVALVFRRPRPGEIDPKATRMELPPLEEKPSAGSPEGGEDK